MLINVKEDLWVRCVEIESVRIEACDMKRGEFYYQVIIGMKSGKEFFSEEFNSKDKAVARVARILAFCRKED